MNREAHPSSIQNPSERFKLRIALMSAALSIVPGLIGFFGRMPMQWVVLLFLGPSVGAMLVFVRCLGGGAKTSMKFLGSEISLETMPE